MARDESQFCFIWKMNVEMNINGLILCMYSPQPWVISRWGLSSGCKWTAYLIFFWLAHIIYIQSVLFQEHHTNALIQVTEYKSNLATKMQFIHDLWYCFVCLPCSFVVAPASVSSKIWAILPPFTIVTVVLLLFVRNFVRIKVINIDEHYIIIIIIIIQILNEIVVVTFVRGRIHIKQIQAPLRSRMKILCIYKFHVERPFSKFTEHPFFAP